MGDRLHQCLLSLLTSSTPFKVVYDRDPPPLHSYAPGEARLPSVHHQLNEHDEFVFQVCEWLEQAQNHYKLQYDRKHQELEFHLSDWVWLHLFHRTINLLNVVGHDKLGPKYRGPF
jgi:hypothetical protein